MSEYSDQYRELLKYINDTPELISTLYDWDLLPEQVVTKTERCNMMIQFVVWYRDEFSKQVAELKREKKNVELDLSLAQKRIADLCELLKRASRYVTEGGGIGMQDEIGEALGWK